MLRTVPSLFFRGALSAVCDDRDSIRGIGPLIRRIVALRARRLLVARILHLLRFLSLLRRWFLFELRRVDIAGSLRLNVLRAAHVLQDPSVRMKRPRYRRARTLERAPYRNTLRMKLGRL